MKLRKIVISAIAAILVCGGARAGGFVKADGPNLTLDGKPYRAVGINSPDLFQATAGIGLNLKPGEEQKDRQRIVDGILDAEKCKIAFFRFNASGFWPIDMKPYFDKPDQYWKSMDEVFNMCRGHNIKLVPSIFFHLNLWPLVYQDPRSAIIDPNSKTYKGMHKYAREIVSRYKDDTNVLMWELTNEGFLEADLNMDGKDAPGDEVYPPEMKPGKKKWTEKDSLSTAMLLQFYKDMTSYIKSIDPNHLVTSGDAMVRPASEGLRKSFPGEPDWKADSMRQYIADLLTSQPEPLDVYSLHLYKLTKETRTMESCINIPALDYDRCLIRAIRATRTPLFIGECANGPAKEDKNGQFARSFIDMCDQEGVALTCFWAWYFPWQPENDLRGDTFPLLMKRIAEFNRKYAGIK